MMGGYFLIFQMLGGLRLMEGGDLWWGDLNFLSTSVFYFPSLMIKIFYDFSLTWTPVIFLTFKITITREWCSLGFRKTFTIVKCFLFRGQHMIVYLRILFYIVKSKILLFNFVSNLLSRLSHFYLENKDKKWWRIMMGPKV